MAAAAFGLRKADLVLNKAKSLFNIKLHYKTFQWELYGGSLLFPLFLFLQAF